MVEVEMQEEVERHTLERVGVEMQEEVGETDKVQKRRRYALVYFSIVTLKDGPKTTWGIKG